MATTFEHDHIECAQNHNISFKKNDRHKIVQRYGQFIAKNQNITSFSFNNISFSLKMFVINEKSILNFLGRQI